MSIKFAKLTTILLVGSTASIFSLPAKAEMQSLNEKFTEAYFTKAQDAFVQSNIISQLDTIFGFTGFPDQHITKDGKAIDNLYQAGTVQQSSLGERMVTRDLANPYDTSIRENPSYSAIK
ncbi:serine/threonine protein kinase [Waterburya agarophytonicola K14]|uniref:Serine/threonine protein kinase n=1 Tax=Waterburya agarophytonicola KI4 TaxID=2874699 RepID=A0A964FET8_9CYAN|nr:serine/threonine protein kinase [Waterburya agarophytonicola]MCC0177025.1 serine/threonine protein kinase [Waterburya agarophytonicola KI4]